MHMTSKILRWKFATMGRFIYILVHSHFDLVSWLLALEATEMVSEPATEMADELINIHLISVQQKVYKLNFFYVTTTINKF